MSVKVQRLHKNKVFVILLVAVMLVFSFQPNKPKAIAPLAFLGAIGVGMAAEALVTMGVKSVSKAVLKKQAQNYSDDITLAGKFDWAGLNPYRNKDGSITLSPTANDRAKMAGLIAGSMAGMYTENAITNDDSPGTGYCERPDAPVGGIKLPIQEYEFRAAYAPDVLEMKRLVTPFYIKQADNTYLYYVRSNYNGEVLMQSEYPAGTEMKAAWAHGSGQLGLYYISDYGSPSHSAFTHNYRTIIPGTHLTAGNFAANNGLTLYHCEDLIIPSTIDRVYTAPMDMSSDFKLPNHDDLSNIPFIINNVFPPSEEEGEITWEELEKYYKDNNLNFDDVMNGNIDNYLEKGDINNYSYTIGEVNNYYTDIPYGEKKEEVIPELEQPTLPVPVPDGDNLPVPVEPIDKSLLVIAKESYQYLADTVKTSVDGLTAVTAGAAGIITFLGTTMGWLPNEWIVMFSAAFGLGLFAFFFRR